MLDQIFTIRQFLEKCWEFNQDIHHLVTDFRQAYDTIKLGGHGDHRDTEETISITKLCINGTDLYVRVRNQTTQNFTVTNRLKQGYGLFPLLINILLDMAIKSVRCS